ncbi:hypothetical protein Tco_0440168 [Tanacetum coccineum]
MEYLPKKIWRQSDRERAKAKIQAIEKMLKSRRIMRSLERFVGGRPSFRQSDTERLSQSDEVLKLKNFKKDATLKLFKSTNQERYEHVGPEDISSQDDQGDDDTLINDALFHGVPTSVR